MVLKGKTVLTTRALSQTSELRSKLEAAGATVIECPAIEIEPVDEWSHVDQAIRRLETYQWLLFTSVNAVDLFMQRMQKLEKECAIPIAVVGTSTAARLRQWKLEPAIVPADFRAEGVIEAMPSDLSNTSILFPRAETAREVLPAELRRRGAKVDVLTVYRTVKPKPGSRSLNDVVSSSHIDCIVFTSPSTIRYLAESLDQPLAQLLPNAAVAVIGPVTRDAAQEFGLRVSIMPEQSTIDALVTAIMNSF